MPPVLCPRCTEHNLERAPDDCESGYICGGYKRHNPGEGCHVLMSEADYKELVSTYHDMGEYVSMAGEGVAFASGADPIEDACVLHTPLREAEKPVQDQTTKRKHKRLKTTEEGSENENNGEAEDQSFAPSDSELMDEEEEEVFDSLPAQTIDVRLFSECVLQCTKFAALTCRFAAGSARVRQIERPSRASMRTVALTALCGANLTMQISFLRHPGHC